LNLVPNMRSELKYLPHAVAASAPFLSIIVPTLNECGNVEPLVNAVERALGRSGWEVIFVDDDSPDGTAMVAKGMARRDHRIRCIRRIGRRGLSTAVIEGALSSSADYVAVIDGDLQHDEGLLGIMVDLLEADLCDVVVASRFIAEGGSLGLNGVGRRLLSRAGNVIARAMLRVEIADPMSGFFIARRRQFEENASELSGRGFKVLLDLLVSAKTPMRVMELPMQFRPRARGASKLDLSVELAFASMLLEKTAGRVVPLRFLTFSLAGGTGVLVHLAVLRLALTAAWPFSYAQGLAALVAMTSNFWLNNLTTYRDKRLKGWRLLTGLMSFYAICSIGFITNVGVGHALFSQHLTWWLSGVLGAAVGAVWNYSASSALTWREP
jgi:dolichol-phosphate mannosyltransferase